MRGADPAIVLVPGRRHVLLRQGQADRPGRRRVLRQRDQRHARRGGALDVRPDRRDREVPDRVLGARGGQARPDAEAQAARRPGRAGHRRGLGHRQGDRRRGSRPRVPASSSPTSTLDAGAGGRAEIGGDRRRRRACTADVTDEDAVQAVVAAAALAFGGVDLVVNNAGLSISKPLLETTVAGLGPPARRDGQGLLPRLAGGRPGDGRPGAGRRHRLHLQQELRLRRPEQRRLRRHQGRPGPPGAAARRRARRARHPGQRRQPRRRGARLRHLRRRLGRQRAEVYGVPEEDLGCLLRPAHHPQARGAARALRQRRVRPDRPDLTHTTGLHIPVDAGVAAAFLR